MELASARSSNVLNFGWSLVGGGLLSLAIIRFVLWLFTREHGRQSERQLRGKRIVRRFGDALCSVIVVTGVVLILISFWVQ